MTRAPVATAWVTASEQSRSLYDHVGFWLSSLAYSRGRPSRRPEALEVDERGRALAERDRVRVAERKELPEAPEAPRRGGEARRRERSERRVIEHDAEVDVDRFARAARTAGEEPLIVVDRAAPKALERGQRRGGRHGATA